MMMFLNLVVPSLLAFYLICAFLLSNGPEEKDRTKCDEHVEIVKVLTLLLSLLHVLFREHWPEMFDVVVSMAGKPGFFQTHVFSGHTNC